MPPTDTNKWTAERHRLENNAYFARGLVSHARRDREGTPEERQVYLDYAHERSLQAANELHAYKQAHPEED